ncbi:sensor histidine kinase [Paenibacillus dakarensis]|uniref:sensor histidine kinase n=1 Tax=Paenibacillus dakarensis TaxID=1527293 RepID=UPI0006D560B2|nr:HAMP domain-containing sensor histidine kinase [Paenibacillus dakarensis]
MRISIKIKFSIFLAVLLLFTVFVLSLLVLQGLKKNQQSELEQHLAQQAATANIYFYQTLTAEPNKVPHTFLATKGRKFAEELEMISGQTIVLYDKQGNIVSEKKNNPRSDSLAKTLSYAQGGKTAYLTDHESLYYFSPLRTSTGAEQVGVVQFYYSLTENLAFYNQMKQLFITMGAGVFILSFILAYVYFNSFARIIIKLNQTVDRIRSGDYESPAFTRRDEIGELSEGIRVMSRQIKKTIQDKDKEQEKLSLAVQKLSQLDQQQKQFIGSVTHEFKTPLTSIRAYIDLLELYPDDEELLKTAKTSIKSETLRLYEMVEKVLKLSSMEKYDFEFNTERIDVRQVIQAVLNSLKGRMEKFGILLETDLTEAYLEADKDCMTIVLVNLLDNAIKYNKAKGQIKVRNEVKDGQVIIDITDTGIGIPEEAARKIFDPFFTVDKNRSRESGGAGLGLSLAKKYTEAQGGTISLVNTNADGSHFRIILPASLN